MQLQEKIRGELRDAMKQKDGARLDTLRSILAACTNEAIVLGKTPQEILSDEQVLSVIRRQIKQRRDAIEQYRAGGRADLIASEQAQLWVLEQYLPAAMPEADIKQVALRKKADLQISDKAKSGILVGAVMKEIGNASDGATVKRIVEELF